ncbi:hypothetical protein BGX38DRAFT_1143079 [Terfezia claveryi]|nr:hypothetical protein BGX38DRAFT_1143079 [Terfezia claveryi]
MKCAQLNKLWSRPPPQVSEPTLSKGKKRVRGVDEEDKGKGGGEDEGGEGYGREGRREKRSRVKRQDYDKVIFTEEHRITKQPSYATGLQDPADLEHDDYMDLEHALETSEPPEGEIVKQKYLDLTQHSQYPYWLRALLPAGEDKIAILPAYEKVSTKASSLNDRYRKFLSTKSRAYKPPPRHLILTGVPGIGIYP